MLESIGSERAGIVLLVVGYRLQYIKNRDYPFRVRTFSYFNRVNYVQLANDQVNLFGIAVPVIIQGCLAGVENSGKRLPEISLLESPDK